MDWKHSPEKRNREDKIKDIKLGQLESKLNARLNKDRANKRVLLIVLAHIFILMLILPIGLVYGLHMKRKISKPDNCKFYSLDVTMDLKAKCQLCDVGYNLSEGGYKCSNSEKVEKVEVFLRFYLDFHISKQKNIKKSFLSQSICRMVQFNKKGDYWLPYFNFRIIRVVLFSLISFQFYWTNMEYPIAKKKHTYPRNFILSKAHQQKIPKQYTFNPEPEPTLGSSAQGIPNPEQSEEEQITDKGSRLREDTDQQDNCSITQSYERAQNDRESATETSVLPKEQEGLSNISERYQEAQLTSYMNQELTKGAEYRLKALPVIPSQNSIIDNQPQKTGKIFKQNFNIFSRRTALTPTKSELSTPTNNRYSIQKPYNQLALSLIGVKRSHNNKSCLERRSSLNFKKNYEDKSYRHDNVEIYQHSYLPFRASDINGLKQQIKEVMSARQRNKEQSPHVFSKTGLPIEPIASHQSKKKIQQHLNRQLGLERIKDDCITIDHKTSLSQLKRLLSYSIDSRRIVIEVPSFFTKPPSQFKRLPDITQEVLHSQACYIFSSLAIPLEGIRIQKYSNCVIVINGNLCIVWHDSWDGKRYFGSWRNKYFDEGAKDGMGLEWSPGRYVYYGQFEDNKRNGFGVMRKNDQSVVVGYWKDGKNIQYGISRNRS